MKRSSVWTLFVFPTLLAGITVNADTLVLRDGRRVDGQLISVHDGVVEFEEIRPFGPGRAVRIDRNDVATIQFDRNDGNTARFPQAPTSPRGRPSGLRERQVMVGANVKWTDTGVDVRSGQDVYFEPSGEVNWGPGRRAFPGGETNSPTYGPTPFFAPTSAATESKSARVAALRRSNRNDAQARLVTHKGMALF